MTRKPDEWMPLHVRKYLGDTMRLTRDQHGAYLLLLMDYWMTGEALPDDDGQLAAVCKATPAEWKRLRKVLEPFFQIENGKWVQKRAEEELSKARGLVEAKVKAGREGAAKRWQKDGTPNSTAMADPIANDRQKVCQGDAPIPLPRNNNQKVVLKDFVVGKGGIRAPMSDANKLALFQKWLAESIGRDGWRIVGTAADPAADGYAEAVQFCRDFAKKRGKGWPHKWPMPQNVEMAS